MAEIQAIRTEVQTYLREPPRLLAEGHEGRHALINEVHHPDLLMPGTRSVLVGIQDPSSTETFYGRYEVIDRVHVTRVEPIPTAAATTSGNSPS